MPVARRYRWNAHNIEHIGRHDIAPNEAEQVVNRARRPYPRKIGEEKWLVWGQTVLGEYIQVVFLEDPEPQETVYVIHARPLNEHEKRLYRRQQR